MMSGCSSSEKKKMAGMFQKDWGTWGSHGAKQRRNLKNGASRTLAAMWDMFNKILPSNETAADVA